MTTDPFHALPRDLSPEEREGIETIKATAEALWQVLESHHTSREMSLAKTNLEMSVMWAVKALTKR